MSADIKTIVKFATTTNASGETINETADGSTLSTSPAWRSVTKIGWKMDVLINIKSLGGTSITFTVKERFSDVGFVETAKSAALTGPGAYFLVHEDTETTVETKQSGKFAMLGKGMEKQVVTATSSVSNVVADIYFIFYN